MMLQAASPLPGAGESRLHLSGSSASIDQHQTRSRGLALLGYSPKPYGSFELVVGDEEIADTAFASRCFYNLASFQLK